VKALISRIMLSAIALSAGTALGQSSIQVNGNGSSDNSAEIQRAVNSCSTACHIVLSNVVVAGQITLPTTADITFSSVGSVHVTGTMAAFYRAETTKTARVSSRVYFDGVTFLKSNPGIIIQENLIFISSTNLGLAVHGCHFQLGNAGAVAIALSADSGTIISDNVFDTGAEAAGTAIETIATEAHGDQTISTPMVATVSGNTFRYGVAFQQVKLASAADPAEGFLFTGNHFIGASVSASGNEINFIGNEFVGASVTLKDLANSTFSGNYVDSGNVPNKTLLTIDSVIQQQVTSNSFISAGQPNTICVAFVNPRGLTSGTTTVTLSGNTYVGSSNTSSGGSGVLFDDPVARNIYLGAENFRSLYAALDFAAILDRSTIDRFEARDVVYYAYNIATYRGQYLRSDPVYAVIQAHLTGTVYSSTGVNVEIGGSTLTFPAMFNNPVVTVAAVKGNPATPCSPDTFPAASNGGNSVTPSSLAISLYSTTGARLGFAACDALITLDDSLYAAPR
jgi:hypothetical protein